MLFFSRVNWFIHNFLQRDPTTRSRQLTSPSREVSKDSIHVKAKKSSSTAKRLSLAVESLSEYLVDNNPERSQSVSQLRRCSAVSLTVPGTSGIRSNSLPGSSTDITDTKHSKIRFQGVEIHITNDGNLVNKGYESGNEERNAGVQDKNLEDTKIVISNEEKMAQVLCDNESNSKVNNSANSTPKQRRKGLSSGPILSVQL